MSQKHEWNSTITTLLERIAIGRTAQSIDADDLPERGSLVCLPGWAWGVSRINVGMKDRSPSGDRLHLPVQVSWQPSQVLVVGEGDTVVADHSVVGMGYSHHGQTAVSSMAGLVDSSVETAGPSTLQVPTSIQVPSVRRAELLARREQLIEDGTVAYWRTIELLEPILAAAISRAERQVSAEAFEGGIHGPGRALDANELDSITTQMLLGEDDDKKPGAIRRLIDRCATPAGQFARVDPQRYIIVAITRDAKSAVRRAVGDPHIGPKVRAMAKSLGTLDLDVLLPAYRERYPSDNLSVQRASAALGLWLRPAASHFPIQEADVSDTSFEDVLVERLDRSRRISQSMGSL